MSQYVVMGVQGVREGGVPTRPVVLAVQVQVAVETSQMGLDVGG